MKIVLQKLKKTYYENYLMNGMFQNPFIKHIKYTASFLHFICQLKNYLTFFWPLRRKITQAFKNHYRHATQAIQA